MTVRIGIIGTGGISRSHLRNLVCNPDAEVVGLCDIVPEQIDKTRQVVNDHVEKELEAGRFARRLDAVGYTDYREMIRKERLDGVYLCLPPYVHGDPEEAVIEAGIHMLVEKPITLDLALASRDSRRYTAQGSDRRLRAISCATARRSKRQKSSSKVRRLVWPWPCASEVRREPLGTQGKRPAEASWSSRRLTTSISCAISSAR